VITSTKPYRTGRAATGGFVLLFAATLFLSSLLMFALEPIVAKTVPLIEAATALHYLVEGRPFGRVVLTI